jgi:hypothetical protein
MNKLELKRKFRAACLWSPAGGSRKFGGGGGAPGKGKKIDPDLQ